MIESDMISMDKKYDPRFCTEVIKLGQEGKTKAQIAAALGVRKRTVDEWIKSGRHPEFSFAMELALTESQAFMEELGMKGIKGVLQKFNPAAWQFAMKNRFREDYKDITDTAISVQQQVKELTDEEMEEQIKMLMAKNIIKIESSGSGSPALIEAE